MAFELPVIMDTCTCGPVSYCSVEVDERSPTPQLRLTTNLCPEPPAICESCFTNEASCWVPPLRPGRWNVVVNGAPAFELTVDPRLSPTPTPTTAMCASFAEPDRCAISSDPLTLYEWRPDSVCVTPDDSRPERATITVASECLSCGDLLGPCGVSLVPRFTDDLPSGGELHVVATGHSTFCDVDCPDICIRQDRECEVPRLVPGDFYRVWVNGEIVTSFYAGPGPTVCAIGVGPVPG